MRPPNLYNININNNKANLRNPDPLNLEKWKNKKLITHVVDMLEMDIVSESVRPELRLANSESRRETGL